MNAPWYVLSPYAEVRTFLQSELVGDTRQRGQYESVVLGNAIDLPWR